MRYRIKLISNQFTDQHYVRPVHAQKWEASYGPFNRLSFSPDHYWSCKQLKTAEKMLGKLLEYHLDKIKWEEESRPLELFENLYEIEQYQ